jgi:dGTPase
VTAAISARPLARWACHPDRSRGRRVAEPDSPPRTVHQRDRDRIVHSNAFRRLVYKTQVFLNHEGDLFRTRLTHSLEVAQIARSAARALALNEDLVEAIALAHDLGHTPFGHAGQDALHECMREHGGFEHNLQSLRVVDRLEQRYFAFDGLNLSFEAREGILKHCSRRNALELLADEPSGPARRFVDGGQPSLEAQLVNLADEIAYVTHDIDDGARSGLLAAGQLDEAPLFARFLAEALRRMLSALIGDLVTNTAATLDEAGPADVDAVRTLPALVKFSAPVRAEASALARHLFSALYRHPRVMETTATARTVVRELFECYLASPAQMSADFAAAGAAPRAVADYIAGMTDRFAVREHERLTGRRLLPA